MAQVVISGEFYHWYSRQHQSKINDVEDATKEWTMKEGEMHYGVLTPERIETATIMDTTPS